MLYHRKNRFQAWKCIESTHIEQTKPRTDIVRNQEQSKVKMKPQIGNLQWEGSTNRKHPNKANSGEKNGWTKC